MTKKYIEPDEISKPVLRRILSSRIVKIVPGRMWEDDDEYCINVKIVLDTGKEYKLSLLWMERQDAENIKNANSGSSRAFARAKSEIRAYVIDAIDLKM